MSPASTQTADEARETLLRTADAEFYREGIASVTMSHIRDRSGVSLRRMYSLFPAKSDLVAEWLEYRHHSWMKWFDSEIDLRVSNGDLAVDAIFDLLAEWLIATDFRGCGFINSLAEVNELTELHRVTIREHKTALVASLAKRHPKPSILAVLIDGAIVQSSVFGNREPVEAAREAAIAISV